MRSLLSLVLLLAFFASTAHAGVTNYTPVFLDCSRPGAEAVIVAIRQFQQDGESRSLVVEANSLATKIVKTAELSCGSMDSARFSTTYYAQIRNRAGETRNLLANSGIRRFERPEVTLTVDMCPSSKGYESRFYDWVKSTKTPIGVALTAGWGLRHAAEFNNLKAMARDFGNITWINHSYHHAYRKGVPNDRNFLLITGTNIENEVLGNEIFMIESGLTPSVYFRFPGLISSRAIVEKLASWGLIPVGSDAWLAKGETPRAGSMILIHGNGNEPAGVQRFFQYLNQILSLGIAPI